MVRQGDHRVRQARTVRVRWKGVSGLSADAVRKSSIYPMGINIDGNKLQFPTIPRATTTSDPTSIVVTSPEVGAPRSNEDWALIDACAEEATNSLLLRLAAWLPPAAGRHDATLLYPLDLESVTASPREGTYFGRGASMPTTCRVFEPNLPVAVIEKAASDPDLAFVLESLASTQYAPTRTLRALEAFRVIERIVATSTGIRKPTGTHLQQWLAAFSSNLAIAEPARGWAGDAETACSWSSVLRMRHRFAHGRPGPHQPLTAASRMTRTDLHRIERLTTVAYRAAQSFMQSRVPAFTPDIEVVLPSLSRATRP